MSDEQEHAKALDGSCIQPCPRCLSDETADLRAEVARLTTRLQTNAENHEAAVQGMLNQLASQRAEYETALALATDTVRDLTAEADAAREEAIEAAAARIEFHPQWGPDDYRHCIRATPHSTALRDRIRELEAQLAQAQTDIAGFMSDGLCVQFELKTAESRLAAEKAAHAATREELAVFRQTLDDVGGEAEAVEERAAELLAVLERVACDRGCVVHGGDAVMDLVRATVAEVPR